MGAGDVRRVLAVGAGIQWLLFLPLSYLLGPVLGCGMLSIWVLGGVLRVLHVAILAALWRDGKWAKIEV